MYIRISTLVDDGGFATLLCVWDIIYKCRPFCVWSGSIGVVILFLKRERNRPVRQFPYGWEEKSRHWWLYRGENWKRMGCIISAYVYIHVSKSFVCRWRCLDIWAALYFDALPVLYNNLFHLFKKLFALSDRLLKLSGPAFPVCRLFRRERGGQTSGTSGRVCGRFIYDGQNPHRL